MTEKESERVFTMQLGLPNDLVRATVTTKDPVKAAKIAQSIGEENRRKQRANLN